MIIRLYNYKSIFLLPVKHRVYRVKNYTVKTKYYLLCIREWCDISHRARIMCVKCEDACSWFYHVFTYNRAGNCKEFYHDRRWKRIKETCAACCCQPRRGVSAVKKKRRYHRRRKRQGWEDVYESVIASILAGSLSRATDSTLDVSVLTYKATFSRFSCREIYFGLIFKLFLSQQINWAPTKELQNYIIATSGLNDKQMNYSNVFDMIWNDTKIFWYIVWELWIYFDRKSEYNYWWNYIN